MISLYSFVKTGEVGIFKIQKVCGGTLERMYNMCDTQWYVKHIFVRQQEPRQKKCHFDS